MSTNKINRVLLLFHKLIKGEQIHKADFARTHDVSERSIERDIEDIRIFLSEIHSNDKLIFDKLENVYYLLTTGNNDKLNNIWNKSFIEILPMSKDKGFLDSNDTCLLNSRSYYISPEKVDVKSSIYL